jgi:hypothetical protein
MNAWVEITPCGGTPIVPPVPPTPGIPVTISLYYTAAAGQVTFSLSTLDDFGNTAVLDSNNDLLVYRSGNRLTYIYDYTVNIVGNSVSLVSPAGVGEPIVFDIVSSTSTGPEGPPGPPGSGGGTRRCRG